MTVDIRFCGGCNPRYDRGAFARRIRTAFPGIRFLCNAEEITDSVILLCGCSAACLRVPEEFEGSRRLVVTGTGQWEEVCSFLENP